MVECNGRDRVRVGDIIGGIENERGKQGEKTCESEDEVTNSKRREIK